MIRTLAERVLNAAASTLSGSRPAAELLQLRWTLEDRFRSAPLPVLLDQLAASEVSVDLSEERSLQTALKLLEEVQAAEAVLSRLRSFTPDTCLYRAIGRYAVLRRRGIPVQFVMGLDASPQVAEGHAWLELQGRALGEHVDPRFAVTFRHPPPAASSATVPSSKKESSAAVPLDAALRPHPDALFTEFADGSGVLLNLRSKFYFSVNVTGVFVWKRLSEQGWATSEGLAQALVEQFETTVETARQDVSALMAEMLREGLILGEESPQTQPGA